MNVQTVDGKNRQDMIFLRMDTDTPTRGPALASKRTFSGSAETGFVWYRRETNKRPGIVLVFSPDLDPKESSLTAFYMIYRAEHLRKNNVDGIFLSTEEDELDADGDGEFDE